MQNQFDIKQNDRPEKALLIGLDTGEYDAEASMLELEELASTAGADVIGTMIQKRPTPDAALYVGSGRAQEISDFCDANDIDLIIADGELTPVQVRNLENKTDTAVIDRTALILDIFAGRAKTSEGKLQVELAQLQYRLPRLAGQGTSLSRLGGGIGTRGPGETKLETDKRHIRRRIAALERQLEAVRLRRERVHERRRKNRALSVAIVGYTNAGKSTLMNALTNAGVLEEDKLFATLDPTARRLTLPDGREIMLVDTVGLVSRLPHELVDAFRSTLEEAVWADVIVNVCDISSPECSKHMQVTADVLESLGCVGKPVINALNKCDLAPEATRFPLVGKCVFISAKTGQGLDELLKAVADSLPGKSARAKLLVPYQKGAVAGSVRKNAAVHSEEYTEGGIVMDVTADTRLLDEWKEYLI